MLAKMRHTLIEFLNVVQAVHHCPVTSRQLDALPTPSVCGAKRIAGVDLQKPRMQAVASAVIALAAAPDGFTAKALQNKPNAIRGDRALSLELGRPHMN